jgi:hypothetical protein
MTTTIEGSFQAKKISELDVLIQPDGNDFVVVLQRSNDDQANFHTYKTEITSFLQSEVIANKITEVLGENFEYLQLINSKFNYDGDTGQVSLIPGVELVVNDVRIASEEGSIPASPNSVIPKKYVDYLITELTQRVDDIAIGGGFDDIYVNLSGDAMTGELILSSDSPSNIHAAASVQCVINNVNTALLNGQYVRPDSNVRLTGNVRVANAPTDNEMVANKLYVDEAVAGVVAPTLDTDDVAEGSTNLYFTTDRARSSISAGGDLSYDSVTGEVTFNDAVLLVNGLQGVVTLFTDNIPEGPTNLYYTDDRFDLRFTAKNTGHLVEGQNLYFTTERVRNSVSAGTGLNYDVETGEFSVATIPPQFDQELNTTDDVQFSSVSTTQLNVQNIDFTGTGAVTINSNNDLNLTALGNVNVPYNPANPADWNSTAPTTVAEALDRLAALLKTLNGGTGA